VDEIAGWPGADPVGHAGCDLRGNDVAMSWKYFLGASILGTGLLLKAGAPLVPLALGISLAALCNWQLHRRSAAKH
jgi:hypothetical protein